ncbi:hypothetical protein [Marisediminicola antarctica]|nr:hypothetical protein [Marisediminicola antarctica]
MTPRHPLPPSLLTGPFLARDAMLARGRLRGRDLTAPFAGTRDLAEAEASLLRLCRAFALRMPPRSFFCGPTAAGLMQIPLPVGQPWLPLHIGVRAGERRIEAAGIHAHHLTLRDGDLTLSAGLALTSPERTWCDLAGSLTLPQLVSAGDFLLWRRKPTTSLVRLETAVAQFPGRRGPRMLRLALPLISDRSDSPPESEIRIAILQAGLPAPDVNEPVRNALGQFVARPDLSWRRFRVALEYEGDHHRRDRIQWAEDIRRINALQLINWIAIRAHSPDYRDPAELIHKLRTALMAGGWDGNPIRHW